MNCSSLLPAWCLVIFVRLRWGGQAKASDNGETLVKLDGWKSTLPEGLQNLRELLAVSIGRTMPQSQGKPSSLRKIAVGSMGKLHYILCLPLDHCKGLEGSSDDLASTKKDKKMTSELPKEQAIRETWGYSQLTI